MSGDDYVQMVNGKLIGTMAFMKGKLKVTGNVMLAQKMNASCRRRSDRARPPRPRRRGRRRSRTSRPRPSVSARGGAGARGGRGVRRVPPGPARSRGALSVPALPITPGHEAAGARRRASAPSGRDWTSVGDRVATMHRDACGECAACKRGDSTLCAGAAWVFGLLADGGYASEIVAPGVRALPRRRRVVARPPTPRSSTAPSARRTATSSRSRASRQGERVLVTGANGGVGCAAVQIAARAGAHVVALVRDAEARRASLRSSRRATR